MSTADGSMGVGPRPGRAAGSRLPGAELLLVASDPRIVAAAEAAARSLGKAPPVRVADGTAALAMLVGPGVAPRHLLCEPAAVGAAWPSLLAAASDPFQPTELIVIAEAGGLPDGLPGGVPGVPPDPARIAEALSHRGIHGLVDLTDAAALASGLSRGEITVRFQPMVRISDRRLVMVEALARWQRPREALGPAHFVAMAERSGLASALTAAVALRALRELAPVRKRLPVSLSFNVPLPVLLEPNLGAGLRQALAGSGFRPDDLLLELTESIEIRDRALLLRALRRLRRDGFGVLLDDLALDDERLPLLGYPFAGVKLDRHLVAALPHAGRARAQVMRVVATARAQGQHVIAEGIADSATWRAVAALKVDAAQGFGVGRPMPAGALEDWARAWAGGRLPHAPPA